VHAALVTDNFDTATFSGGVIYSTLTYGPAIASNTHTLSLGTLAGSPAMVIGGGTGSIYVKASLPSTVSLDNLGDFIQMDFQFSTTGGTNGNRVLRYGFFQSGTTDDEALGFFLAGQNAGSGNSLLMADTSTSANPFYTTAGSAGTSGSITADAVYDAWFRIERTSATELTLSGNHGGTSLSTTHTIGPSSATSFDEVWFGIQNRTTTFRIDNLVVTIPEPGATAFLAVGFGSAFLIRRLRRAAARVAR